MSEDCDNSETESAEGTLPNDAQSEDELRAAWRDLVERRLPQAWQPGWPVRFDHCFARILLDTSFEKPWREAVPPPAWKNTPLPVLRRAVASGEAVLAGEADIGALNRQSLRLRAKLRG